MGNYNLFRSKYYLIVSLHCLSAMPGGAKDIKDVESGLGGSDVYEEDMLELSTPESSSAISSDDEHVGFDAATVPYTEKSADAEPNASNYHKNDSSFTAAISALGAAQGFSVADQRAEDPIPLEVTAVLEAHGVEEGFSVNGKDEMEKANEVPATTGVMDVHASSPEFQKENNPKFLEIPNVYTACMSIHGAVDTEKKVAVEESEAKVADNTQSKGEKDSLAESLVDNKDTVTLPNDVQDKKSSTEERAVESSNKTSYSTNHIQLNTSANYNAKLSMFTAGAMYYDKVLSIYNLPICLGCGVELDCQANIVGFIRPSFAISNFNVDLHLGVAIKKSELFNLDNFRVTAMYSFDDILSDSVPFSIKSGLEVSMKGTLYCRFNLGYLTFSLNLNNFVNSCRC